MRDTIALALVRAELCRMVQAEMCRVREAVERGRVATLAGAGHGQGALPRVRFPFDRVMRRGTPPARQDGSPPD